MADPTVIGSGTLVRGRVSGSGDLEIAGRLEGDVACSGEVLVDASGLVAANISARRIVVRGAVKGDLSAEDALVVEAGAKIVGDLRAPRVGIAAGGLVRGHVQTGGAGTARPRAQQASAARSAPAKAAPPPATRLAIPDGGKAPPPPAVRSAANGPSRPAPVSRPREEAGAPRGATLAGARVGPPPPVVPVLKKGTKAVQKKR